LRRFAVARGHSGEHIDLKNNIRSLQNNLSIYKNDYEGLKCNLDSTKDNPVNFTGEFVNLRSALQNNKVDFQSFKDNLERQMAMLEKNTDTKLDEIGSEIKKLALFILL
jgi:hypothetical protein